MSRAGTTGFTLVELLVAVAVLAVLASLTFRGLTSLAHAEVRVRGESDRWAGVARFLEQVDRDLSLATDDPSIDASGALLVTRRSEGDPGAPDIAPRRVAFRLQGERLEYLSWPAGTAAPQQPLAAPILDKVAALEWRTLDASGVWTAGVPSRAVQTAAAAPRAMEARLSLASGERITRIFLVR